MLHLANPNLSPPGSFRYRDSELAAINPKLALIGPDHAMHDNLVELNRRRTANGLAPISQADYEDRICKGLPPGFCRDENNLATTDPAAASLGLMDVISGTSALASWFVNGMKRVSVDEITRRSYICNECPQHKPIAGCQSCSGAPLRSIINKLIGGQSLGTDAMLGACGVCRCSLVAKTRMEKAEILKRMPAAQQEQLWDKCWLKET